jgi:DNA repair protein RecO (recombination protein O)
VRAIGKGVRRPKSRVGGHVELFTHVNVLVAQGRNLDIITQAEALRTFGAIRDDLWKASYACYCAELVDRLTEERLENRAIFDLLLQQMRYLDGAEQPGQRRAELSVRTFELRLLGLLGYAPELYHCVECSEPLRPGENRISASAGGTVCAGCGPTHPGARALSVNAIKAMRLMSGEPYGVFQRLQLPAETAAEIAGALRAHVNYILERQLRTAEFLDRLKASEAASAPSPTRLPA